MTKTEFMDWLKLEVSGLVIKPSDGFAVADYDENADGLTVYFEDGSVRRVAVQ